MFRKAKHAKKSAHRKHINILLCVLLVVSLVFAGTVLGKYIVEKTLDDTLNLTITGGAPTGTFTLKPGGEFNDAISPLLTSSTATKIQFGSWEKYGRANGFTWSEGTNVGVEDNTIKAFATDTTVYILSGGDMYANEDCSNMFRHGEQSFTATDYFPYQRLTAIDGIENVNTSNVKNMSNMFYRCQGITSLDLSSFNTENVESMDYMFYRCSKLTSLNISGFDTSKVTNMSYMFNYCQVLKELDITHFKTGNVENMSYMFDSCYQLKSLDLNNFDTTKVTNMSRMFYGCTQLTELDIKKFSTGNVENMSGMFQGCQNVSILDLRGLNLSKVTNMANMFRQCFRLQTIYVDYGWNASNVTESTDMFYDNSLPDNAGCLTGGAGSSFYTYGVKDKEFARIDGGTNLPGYLTAVPEAVTLTTGTKFNEAIRSQFSEDVTKLRFGNHLLLTADIPELADLWTNSDIYVDADGEGSIRVVTYGDTVYVISKENSEIYANADSSYMFSGGSSASALNNIGNYLTEIVELDNVITDKVENMAYMFANCPALATLDVTSFETDNVTDMSNMFSGCSVLTNLDVSYFNTSLVTNMSNMFNGCSAVTTLDVSDFETSLVTNMSGMFSGCSAVTNLDISGFETSLVTDMSGMFANMSSLLSLELSNFDTSAVTDMSAMFQGCSSLTVLDLTAFDTGKVTAMTDMFRSSSKIKTIYVSAETWKTDSVTGSANMFLDCTAILGEQGTRYDSTKIDKEYARIDRAISDGVKGYLTGEPLMAILKTGPEVQSAFINNITSENTIQFTTYDELAALDSALTELWESSESFVDVGDIGVIRVFTSGNTIYVASKGSMEIFANPDSNHMLSAAWPSGGQIQVLRNNIAYLNGLNSINTSKVTNMRDMFEESNVSSLDISEWDTSNVTNMRGMFYSCGQLRTLNVLNFDTSNVTNMNTMFGFMSQLTVLDLASFDTTNVTNMNGMFKWSDKLTTIYVNDTWTTENVDDSTEMFLDCDVLVGEQGTRYDSTKIDKEYARIDKAISEGVKGYLTAAPVTLTTGSEFDAAINSLLTSTVTSIRFGTYNEVVGTDTTLAAAWANSKIYVDAIGRGFARAFVSGNTVYIVSQGNMQIFANPDSSYMFYDNTYIKSFYGLDKVNTSKVTSMNRMFDECHYLESLDLSSWDTSSVTDMAFMFANCANIKSINVSNFDTGSVTDMSGMFIGCDLYLTELDISSFNTKNVTSMSQMFWYCRSLITISVGDGWTTENVTASAGMFYDCRALLGGECTPFDSAVTDMTYARADKAISQGVKGYLTDANAPGAVQLTAANKFGNTMKSLLSDKVTNIQIGTYDDIAASNATLSAAWAKSTNYVDVDGKGYARAFVSGDTVYVLARTNSVLYAPEDSTQMFAFLPTLKNVYNVKTLNTSKVTNMTEMFAYCPNLESLDLSGWDTSNVTDMECIFRCGQDSEGFNKSSLASLDLSGWDTSKVTSFEGLFYGCSELTVLDLSSFETTYGIPTSDGSMQTYLWNMSYVFYGCESLHTIYVDPSRWTLNPYKGGDTFKLCYQLVGGNGTAYWPNENAGCEYACVDESGSPGYFTDIAQKTGASALSLDDTSAAEDEESDGTTVESGSQDTAAAESAADSTAEAILPVAQTKEESESETEPDADDPDSEEE